MAEGSHQSMDGWSGSWFVCDADLPLADAVQALRLAMGDDVSTRYDDLDLGDEDPQLPAGEYSAAAYMAIPEQRTAVDGLSRTIGQQPLPPTLL